MNEERAARAAAAGYVVRVAEPGDAERMAQVHTQVWRDTYTGLMRQEVLDRLDPEAGARRWRSFLTSPAWDRTVWVGLDPAGQIVAMAAAGPARDADAPVPHELRAINVLRSAQGSGLADLLMTQLVGERAAYLWVVEGNERAIAFYRRYGFTDHGRRWDEEYGVTELCLVRGGSPRGGGAA